MLTLDDYIKNNIGIDGFNFGRKKLFYPKKPHSCLGCKFYNITQENGNCGAGFNPFYGRPQTKCYPVKGEEGAGNRFDYHADAVLQTITKLRNQNKNI